MEMQERSYNAMQNRNLTPMSFWQNDNKMQNINKMHASKLIKIVHFLGKQNLPIKELYPALLYFLAFNLEEPITKQYLENCPKNATYGSHATADSLIFALKEFIKKQMDTKLRNASDVVTFADEGTSVARKKVMGIFLSCYNGDNQKFLIEYLVLLEVPSTKSAILLGELVKILKEPEIDFQKTSFCCLDGTNSMSEEMSGLQRIRHISPHSMYVNCRCHRLTLCFKHLIDQFSWLAKLDKLLLGLWKLFHYSALNHSIVTEILKAYRMKALHLVKAVFTRWLSHARFRMQEMFRKVQRDFRSSRPSNGSETKKLANTSQII